MWSILLPTTVESLL